MSPHHGRTSNSSNKSILKTWRSPSSASIYTSPHHSFSFGAMTSALTCSLSSSLLLRCHVEYFPRLIRVCAIPSPLPVGSRLTTTLSSRSACFYFPVAVPPVLPLGDELRMLCKRSSEMLALHQRRLTGKGFH